MRKLVATIRRNDQINSVRNIFIEEKNDYEFYYDVVDEMGHPTHSLIEPFQRAVVLACEDLKLIEYAK